MNTTNILAVADAIEQHTIPWLGFNMGPFFSLAVEREYDAETIDQSGHDCGTVACIAGHVAVLMRGVKVEPQSTAEAYEVFGGMLLREAADWLGLAYGSKAKDLFFAYSSGRNRHNIPADQAVRTLRHLAATGNVDWTV